jgi:hypothetical protein
MLASLFSDCNSCFWWCPNSDSAGSKCSLFKRLGREVNIESRFGSVLIWTALVLSPNVTGFDDCLVIIMAIMLPNGPAPNRGFVIECHYNYM